MKKIIILLLTLTVGFSSCKDYLNIVPTDAKFLNDMNSIKATLATMLYNMQNGTNFGGAPQSFHHLQYTTTTPAYCDVWSFGKWESNEANNTEVLRRRVGWSINDNYDWKGYYNLIGFTNLIIFESERAVGSEDMRDYVMGEAFIHRAYYIFKVLQNYAPMDDASIGIPLNTDVNASPKDIKLVRLPQKDIYKQIFSDLDRVEACLKRTAPRATYNVMYSYDYLYRILAQVYTWKASSAAAESDDWAKAVQYARAAIATANGALPYSLEDLKDYVHGIWEASLPSGGTQVDKRGQHYPEALWWFNSLYGIYANPNPTLDYDLTYDIDVWKSLYKDNDRRKKLWFLSKDHYDKSSDQIVESDLDHRMKFNLSPYVLFRLSETYLILVEGLAHTDFAAAKQVWAQWQALRYEPGTTLWVPSSAQELIDEMYSERRREFLMEGDVLWLSMKRFRVAASRTVWGETYTLAGDDWRYQFKIPDSEIVNNPHLDQDPNWNTVNIF